MSDVVIQTSTELAAYVTRVDIAGVTYELRFRWNSRAEMWMMDVRDVDGNLIVAGRRCTVNFDILEQFSYMPELPVQAIVAFDTTLRDTDPILNDFGSRVLLLSIDPIE